MMKAVVLDAFGGVENLHWRDWMMPEPGEGEIRIKINGIAVNPVDYKMRKGLIPGELPAVLGRDVSGIVDAIGPGRTQFQEGDEVFALLFGPKSNGAYAEYVTTSAHFVCKKPSNLSFIEASILGVAGITAYDAVMKKAEIQPKDTVLVVGGSGGVGSFAISFLKHLGVSTVLTTTGGHNSKEYLVRKLKLPEDHLVSYVDRSVDEMMVQIKTATNGKGVDVAFDFVGGEMKKLCFNAVGFDGRIVSVVEEPPEFDFDIWRADTSPFFAKSGTYHFVAASARARNGGPDEWAAYGGMMSDIVRLVETGKIDLPEITDLGSLSAETIREAHMLLETGKSKGKLALTVG